MLRSDSVGWVMKCYGRIGKVGFGKVVIVEFRWSGFWQDR